MEEMQVLGYAVFFGAFTWFVVTVQNRRFGGSVKMRPSESGISNRKPAGTK